MTKVLIIVLFIFMSSNLFAKEILLFTLGTDGIAKPVEGYAQVVASIRPSDTVVFSESEKWRIEHRLGEGDRTAIFSLAGDSKKVLRIPLDRHFISFINESIIGYHLLNAHRLRIVKLYEMKKNEFLIAERFPSKVASFADLAFNEKLFINTGARDALLSFAVKVAHFSHIGDFKHESLIFDLEKKEWILFDWTSFHKNAFHEKNGTIEAKSYSPFNQIFFDSLLEMDGGIFKPTLRNYTHLLRLKADLDTVISNERSQMIKSFNQSPSNTSLHEKSFLFPAVKCEQLLSGV